MGSNLERNLSAVVYSTGFLEIQEIYQFPEHKNTFIHLWKRLPPKRSVWNLKV